MASKGARAKQTGASRPPAVSHHVDLPAQLLEATAQGKAKIVKRLLDNRVDVNCANAKKESPLLLAASLRDPEPRKAITTLLLDRGAQINASDNDGRTPLISAVKNQDAELVTTLLQKGSDVKQADNEGNTPLCHAANAGDPDIVKKVVGECLRHKMSVDHKNMRGLTPLLIAAQNSHLEAARVLVEKGKASVTIRDLENFMTPEDWMKETSCYSMGELLFLSPKTRRKRTRKEVKLLSDFLNDPISDPFEKGSQFQFRVESEKIHLPQLNNDQPSNKTPADWSNKSMFEASPAAKSVKLPSFSHGHVVPLAPQRGKLKLSFDKLPSLQGYSIGNSFSPASKRSGFYAEGSLEPLKSPTMKGNLKRQDSMSNERVRRLSLTLPFLETNNDKKFAH